jgi:hypothetical protein
MPLLIELKKNQLQNLNRSRYWPLFCYIFATLQFFTTIETAIGKRVFYFNRLHYLERVVYHVTVFGQYSNRYFTLERRENEWEFSKPEFIIDSWIGESLEELRDALKIYHQENLLPIRSNGKREETPKDD